MDFLPQAYTALNKYKQFIIYVLQESKTRKGKTDKLPVDYRTGIVTNAHNPDMWTYADTAIATAKAFGQGYGVGFVLTKDDPFFFLDIDDCLEPCGTKWSPLAMEIVTMFKGAAIEISSSGRGLHIIGSTSTMPPHSCRNAEYKIELYSSGRFIALTGQGVLGTADLNPEKKTLENAINVYFSPATTASEPLIDWTTEPVAGWNGNTDDNELLARALRSGNPESIFGAKARFRDLYEANEAVLAMAYPPNDTDVYNRSNADAALAQHLAFWTGGNCERIARLMEGSALKREKWERKDYLPLTIRVACGRQKEYLKDRPPEYTILHYPFQEDETPRPQLVTGSTFLTIDQQIEFFTGFVYISDEHKVMNPTGELFTPERFRTFYGGNQMILDPANAKTTRNAFEAFTESQGFRSPRADSSCFLPKRRPGSIIIQDGRRLVNVYYPADIRCVSGDITPFIEHITKLFPSAFDQEIIFAYLAALVQHVGTKFQWAPLIQGVQGNGKTYITRIIAYAIGQQYCHFPRAEDIDNNFNSWLYRKLFIGVEDIYLRDSKGHVIEILKPMITNDRQEVEPKGRDKITVDICANFILNSNHKDGLKKTRDDRRFAPFYTAQQTVEDLKRDGMTGDYFPKFKHWLEQCDGYAKIVYFLRSYAIPDELNPATLSIRAPHTSSTEAAIEHSIGRIEQEILEAIEQGLPGFRGGWVSSIFLDRFLVQIKADRAVPMRRRREMMQSLGYDWHPQLKDGRVTRNVQPDGGKPRLYIKLDQERPINDPVAAYTEAQAKTD